MGSWRLTDKKVPGFTVILGIAAIALTAADASAMYNSATGRWMQRDPIEYADGLNSYEYVRSVPTVYTDPSGNSIGLLLPMHAAGGFPKGWQIRATPKPGFFTTMHGQPRQTASTGGHPKGSRFVAPPSVVCLGVSYHGMLCHETEGQIPYFRRSKRCASREMRYLSRMALPFVSAY